MNLADKILEELGLRYEDLNPTERETYTQQVFNIKNLTLADLKEHIIDCKNSVALQLTDVISTEDKEKDLILKARLKNYVLLEAFLTTPDRAEKSVRDSLKNVKPPKGK